MKKNPAKHLSNPYVKKFWNNGEVRLNDDGSVDEVVVVNPVLVHVEQMDSDYWWMSIDGAQGRRMVFHFTIRGKKIHLALADDGHHSSGIEIGFK